MWLRRESHRRIADEQAAGGRRRRPVVESFGLELLSTRGLAVPGEASAGEGQTRSCFGALGLCHTARKTGTLSVRRQGLTPDKHKTQKNYKNTTSHKKQRNPKAPLAVQLPIAREGEVHTQTPGRVEVKKTEIFARQFK